MRHINETFWWYSLMKHFDDNFWWDILMAENGWKFVLNMLKLVIQLLNCTTGLSKLNPKSSALIALALFWYGHCNFWLLAIRGFARLSLYMSLTNVCSMICKSIGPMSGMWIKPWHTACRIIKKKLRHAISCGVSDFFIYLFIYFFFFYDLFVFCFFALVDLGLSTCTPKSFVSYYVQHCKLDTRISVCPVFILDA